MFILAQTESKELDFLLCEDTGHLALFRVHFQFQPAFQILPAGFQTGALLHACFWQAPQHLYLDGEPWYQDMQSAKEDNEDNANV